VTIRGDGVAAYCCAHLLSKAGFRAAETETITGFESACLEFQKNLTGRKMNAPIDAYHALEKLPLDQMAYLLAESNNSAALSKIRAYLNKWRPIRSSLNLVSNELEAIGMPRGPKFDNIVEQVFAIQLLGRGKTPEDRIKILRKLSGIKEAPKKKEKKPGKGGDKSHAAAAGKHAEASAPAKTSKAQHRERLQGKHAAKAAAHAARGKAAGAKKSSGRK